MIYRDDATDATFILRSVRSVVALKKFKNGIR
jgi:hypothetical protein